VLLGLAVLLGLTACGGGGSVDHAKPASTVPGRSVSTALEEPSAPANPTAVVARVGSRVITGAMFNHYSEGELSGSSPEQLVPPQFSACVAHSQAEAAGLDERAVPPPQLRSECKKRYQTVLQAALEHLISNEWLIGAARELGASTSNASVDVSSDPTLEKQAKLAGSAIRRAIKGRVARVTHGQIESYYDQHRFEYLLTASRDLEIARTTTEAEAAKVKSEIESGKSFAAAISKLPVQQPINSNDGRVTGLGPHFYGEPNLNQAIFNASPGVLVGPVDTWFGYFVFKVTKVGFEHVTPLAEVEAAIRQHFAGPLEERALAAFNKRWSATWTAQTDCSRGYVVPKCRQFKGTPVTPPEPSALD
jgi:hypothetical protein